MIEVALHSAEPSELRRPCDCRPWSGSRTRRSTLAQSLMAIQQKWGLVRGQSLLFWSIHSGFYRLRPYCPHCPSAPITSSRKKKFIFFFVAVGVYAPKRHLGARGQ